MVHAKTDVPKLKPVIEVVGDNEFVIVPDPETNVHTPVPTAGLFPFMNVAGEEIQSVCVAPAFAAVGTLLILIATVEDDAGQGELEMVH